jgi:hypothetical protein
LQGKSRQVVKGRLTEKGSLTSSCVE